MTADDQLHGHVAREGVVDEHVNAPVGAGFHDGVALLDLVGIHDDVSGLGDDARVFLRHARDEEDVVAAHLTDGVEGGVAPGTAWHITMAFTSGSAANAVSLAMVVSCSAMN